MVHTNSIESVWAVLKQGYNSVYHSMNKKHLGRYINEFAFRLNEGNCEVDTIDRLKAMAANAARVNPRPEARAKLPPPKSLSINASGDRITTPPAPSNNPAVLEWGIFTNAILTACAVLAGRPKHAAFFGAK